MSILFLLGVLLPSAFAQRPVVSLDEVRQQTKSLMTASGFRNVEVESLPLQEHYANSLPPTHSFNFTSIHVRSEKWSSALVKEYLAAAARIFGQCRIRVSTTLISVDSPTLPAAADVAIELIEVDKMVPQRKTKSLMTYFYYPRTKSPYQDAIHGKNFSVRSNAKELIDTVWALSVPEFDPGKNLFAHELGHFLTGDGDHSKIQDNLMRQDWSKLEPHGDKLTSKQCEQILKNPHVNPINPTAPAGTH